MIELNFVPVHLYRLLEAELEQQLATDWTNIDLVNSHKAARDDLASLIARWETMFETV